jgi:hypothetical protein
LIVQRKTKRSKVKVGGQILKDNEVSRREIGPRLAPKALDADSAGTGDGVAYQSLYRADHQGGQRNLPEGLFVLLQIKRNAGMMTGRVPRATLFFLFTFAFFLSATAR